MDTARFTGSRLGGTALTWLEFESPGRLTEWTGTPADMHAIAARLGLAPWTGSPLVSLSPSGTVASPAPSLPGIAEAWQAMAQPELRLDLSHAPPAQGATLTVYGRCGSPSFVGHWIDGGTHHLAWPFEPVWLARLTASLVETDARASNVGVSMDLDRNQFEVVVALVDLLQEASLVALLEGRDVGPVRVDPAAVLTAFSRPRAVRDLRWMIARAQRMAPRPLNPDASQVGGVLAGLARDGWLVDEGAYYLVAPTMRLVCGLLADTRGWCAVSRCVRRATADDGIEWSREHGAVLRGLDSAWGFEFSDITSSGFRVRLRDVASAEVTARVNDWFAPATMPAPAASVRQVVGRVPPPLPDVRLDEAPPIEWFYASGGETVGPVSEAGLSELVARGTVTADTLVWHERLDGWQPAGVAGLVKVEPESCPACGVAWRPGARFCPTCGHRR